MVKDLAKRSLSSISLAFIVTLACSLFAVTFAVANTQAQVNGEGELSAQELFAQANNSYDSAQYIEAIRDYNQVLLQGQESAPLYYNLGNAYYEAGDLGNAILNYLRAQRLDPTDRDIADNLAFAKSFVSLQLEGVKLNPFTDFLSSITGPWKLAAWGWLTSALLLAFSSVVLYRILGGENGSAGQGMAAGQSMALKFAPWALASLVLLSAGLSTFKFRSEFSPDRAVVTIPGVSVTNKPSADSEIEFEAVAGLEVEITAESEGYYLTLFENKRQGWLPVEAVSRL